MAFSMLLMWFLFFYLIFTHCELPPDRLTTPPSSSLHTCVPQTLISIKSSARLEKTAVCCEQHAPSADENTPCIFFLCIFFFFTRFPAWEPFFVFFFKSHCTQHLQWKIPPISHTRSVSTPTLFPPGWIPFSLNGPTLYAVAALMVSSLRRLAGQDKDMPGWLFLSRACPPTTPPSLPAMQ